MSSRAQRFYDNQLPDSYEEVVLDCRTCDPDGKDEDGFVCPVCNGTKEIITTERELRAKTRDSQKLENYLNDNLGL